MHLRIAAAGSHKSPSHGLFIQSPCEKASIVVRIVHRLEPLVGGSIHRTKCALHSYRSLRSQWAFFVAQQVGKVGELGHRKAMLRWPRIRAITAVVDERREIVVDSSTDAFAHSPCSREISDGAKMRRELLLAV